MHEDSLLEGRRLAFLNNKPPENKAGPARSPAWGNRTEPGGYSYTQRALVGRAFGNKDLIGDGQGVCAGNAQDGQPALSERGGDGGDGIIKMHREEFSRRSRENISEIHIAVLPVRCFQVWQLDKR